MVSRAHALARDELVRVLIAYTGVATADGAADGTTIIDTFLINNPLISPTAIAEKTVLIVAGNARGEDRASILFNNANGTITLEGVGFSAQILAGTVFRIVNFSSADASLIAIILALLEGVSRPSMELYEGWQDELGIDFTLWTPTNPATPWSRGAGAGVAAASLVATAPLLINEVARLVGNQRWPVMPDLAGTNTILRATEFEFEMTLSDVTQLVPGTCFFGFTPNQADTRANQNIIGFGLVGAAPAQELETVTDLATVETVNSGFGINLANLNKFKIRAVQLIGISIVQFYVNEVLIAAHLTNLPDLPMYPNWYNDTTALGACTPQLGIVRIWTRDFLEIT